MRPVSSPIRSRPRSNFVCNVGCSRPAASPMCKLHEDGTGNSFTMISPQNDDACPSSQEPRARMPTSQPVSAVPPLRKYVVAAVVQWFDTDAVALADGPQADRIDWLRVIPFIGMHLACLGVIWVGVSRVAVAVAAALYTLRMFALT